MRTETDRAYMAGFIDGEGHIGIGILAGKHGKSRHTLTVTITNTNIDALKEIAKIWDGKVLGFRKRKVAWSLAADIRWCTESAVAMLKEIQPYLIGKREQCRVALEFAELLRHKGTARIAITSEEWDKREALRVQIRKLNRKAVNVEPIKLNPKPTLKCQYCGKEFQSYERLRKYCSLDCRMSAGRAAYVDRHTTTKNCPACGKTFTARLNQQYCSISCGRSIQPPPVPKGTKRSKATD